MLARDEGTFRISPQRADDVRRAIEGELEARRDRVEGERFVRGHVLRGMIGVDPRMQLRCRSRGRLAKFDTRNSAGRHIVVGHLLPRGWPRWGA